MGTLLKRKYSLFYRIPRLNIIISYSIHRNVKFVPHTMARNAAVGSTLSGNSVFFFFSYSQRARVQNIQSIIFICVYINFVIMEDSRLKYGFCTLLMDYFRRDLPIIRARNCKGLYYMCALNEVFKFLCIHL